MKNTFSNIFGESATPASSNTGAKIEKLWQIGSVVLNDYLIEKKLGQGGMGKVWLVKSNSTGSRFAVKQTLMQDKKHRKEFLTELKMWIDLPEHPNIVSCRFFRTDGDELFIFSDYIEGGSLADWIAERKLTSLEQILGIAIQFAWGLQAIHERGLIHQDIKPGNVLMTAAGVPRITDFGLARTHLRKESILGGFNGMTPAYASPEQCAGEPLSRQTDIWSWGICVLDMFMGDVSCPYGGNIAAEVLKHYLENGQKEAGLPVMPQQIADVLIKCFNVDISMRWGSLKEVIEILSKFAFTSLEHAYRWKKTLPISEDEILCDLDIAGAKWQTPYYWINIAKKLGALDLPECNASDSLRQGSRKVHLVEDFGAYQQIETSLRTLIMQGKTEATGVLGQLRHDMALILQSAGDLLGGAQALTEAISLMELSVSSHPDTKILAFLPMAYMNQAIILGEMGRHKDSIVVLDRGIARANALAAERWWWHFDDLASLYFNKANRLRSLSEFQSAVENYDKALQTIVDFEKLLPLLKDEFRITKEEKFRHLLALIHTNKASVLRKQGDLLGAVRLYDIAIGIRERQVHKDMNHFLAMIYMNKAMVEELLGNVLKAMTLTDKAISIWESLRINGSDQSLYFLSRVLSNKALLMERLGNSALAVSLLEQSIDNYRHLINKEGRNDLMTEITSLEHHLQRLTDSF